MIVGILFVSFSTRGHQLVYSYPEVGPDGKYLGFEAAFLADILSPKSALCDKKFQLKINQISFIGHPTLLNVDRPNSGLIYSRKIQNLIVQNKKLSPLTMFHLVFAMSNCVQDEIDLVYDHCLLKITTGFKFEQMKRGYIRSETEKIITIRDEVPKEDANDEILKQSTLAQTLMLVYETMIGKVGATITINHSLRVSIQPNLVTLRALSQSKGANLTNRKYPTMKPYHTLLLLKDPQVIVASMPKDSSPFLITMIESLSPTISFEQLQTTLGCSLGQIFKFAAHLYFWGYAKIVQTIKTRNFYRISQTANFMDIAEIKQDLFIRFPEFDAMSFLRDLSTPKPLHSIISSKESRYTYLEALTYLLGRDFIAQIHMYLVLIVPKSILEKVSPDPEKDIQAVIPEPSNPKPFEKLCIQQMISNQHNPIVKQLFQKMLPHINGRTTLDEISFQENITRKELKLVMSNFRDEIAVVFRQE